MVSSEELLKKCTVKIVLRQHGQDQGQGTGFFVSENLVLTCAHVIEDFRKEDIAIVWQGKENVIHVLSIELEISESNCDVALLKVETSEVVQPLCVELDHREGSFESRDKLHTFGYPWKDYPDGRPVDAECQGSTGAGEIDFKLGSINPGMSGAPLLNQRTGKVCGIVHYTQGRGTLLGGGAIPISGISKRIPDLIKLNSASKSNMRQMRHKTESIFSNLISEKTENFIGRSYVFSAINSFIREESNGYFVLTGYPGQGKSSILAKYVQDHECIHFFNEMSEGNNKTSDFLRSVHSQLINNLDTGYSSVPNDAESSGAFLVDLLNRASSNTQKPIVIVVDALDEVNTSGHPKNSNILYLPSRLPDKVYFIISVRSEFNITLNLKNTPEQNLDLDDDAFTYQTLEDIRQYITEQVIQSSTLERKIQELGESLSSFIERVAEKSDKNFMYLYYIINDLKNDKVENLTSLDHLPKGLQQYYQWHWERMEMSPKDRPPPKDKIRVLFVLAELREAVSRTLLIYGYLNNSDRVISQIVDSVDSVLNDWEQFLKTKEVPPEIFYYIYHSSFREFLISVSKEYKKLKERYPEIFRELERTHKSIADVKFKIWSDFENEEDVFR